MGAVPLRFDGRPAFLRAGGPATGRTVLFLHPFPLDGSCWDDFLARATRAGLRGATVDAPGFGKSDAAFVSEANPLLAQNAGKLRVVSSANAQMPVIAFAPLLPADRDALQPAIRPPADSEEAKQRREEQALAALAQGPEAVTGTLLPKLVSPSSGPVALDLARSFARSATAQGIADALRGMALRPDSTPDLERWRVPSVVVAGKDDQVIPAAETDALARGIRGAAHAVIQGAGHFAFLEKPDEVWTAIEALLARIDQPSARR